jgi:hypothetical protein
MRINWLYFSCRTGRASEPFLVCNLFVATARSATVAFAVALGGAIRR